jgi:hypothetical protein
LTRFELIFDAKVVGLRVAEAVPEFGLLLTTGSLLPLPLPLPSKWSTMALRVILIGLLVFDMVLEPGTEPAGDPAAEFLEGSPW